MNKYLALFIISCLFLVSCNFKKKTSDLETNKYWVDYVRIYNDYEKVSTDSTKKDLESYLHEFPNDARAWAFLGTVLDKTNDSSALFAYSKAIQLDTNMAGNYSRIGSWYGRHHQLNEAKKNIAKAIEKGDSTDFTKANYVLTLTKLKNKKEALNAFQNFMKLDSLSPSIQLSLGYSMHQLGERKMEDSLLLLFKKNRSISEEKLNQILTNQVSIDEVLTNFAKQ